MGAWIALVAVVGSLGGIIWSSRRPLVRCDVRDGHLIVQPRGLNAIWSLRARLSIPLRSITHVQLDVDRKNIPRGWRVGTDLPGVLTAGTFRSRSSKAFWLVGRSKNVTVIDCEGTAFDRLVLELPGDAKEVIAPLARAVPPGVRVAER